jgi:cell division protein FtsB
MFKKNNKNKINYFFSAKVLAFLGFCLIIAISLPLSKSINKHYKISKEIKDLEREIKNMEDKNNNLNKLIKFIGSDEFADKQARLNLNYKKEGEEVVIIKNKEEAQNEKISSVNATANSQPDNNQKENLINNSNVIKWLKYFIK